ncbi:AbrB family transcriptional regulator [Brasilonema sp. UFV-L1]|uniref:AbrB family transcriptional regulator n=1 Tax=Brasilonema sp. UFV-L1 TaxID=2234130 RepID=UPI001B7CF9A0|nr:AbrB family transcriptional regulator [Brasilonema sp. UFV-L1]
MSEIPKIIQQLVTAILAGFLFHWLHIPVGWLLGPMLVGIAYAVIKGDLQPFPSTFKTVGQVIIGIVTATRLSPETLSVATSYAIPMLLCVLITASLSMLSGYLLSRWAGIDATTCFLGFIPGGASSIVAMSEEIGADTLSIAVIQYIRVLLVVLILPTVATLLFPTNPDTQVTATVVITNNLPTLPMLLNLLILVVCGGLGIWGGRQFRLPSSGFLGPFLVGLVVFWMLPFQIQMPQPLFYAGQLLIGLSIGVQFDWQTVHKLLRAVFIEVGLVIVLILLCLGVGYGFHVVTHVDTVTAVLGFTPGGIEAMIATVMQLGGDTGLVLAMQLTRMLSILLIAPWLVAFLVKRAKSAHSQLEEEEELVELNRVEP